MTPHLPPAAPQSVRFILVSDEMTSAEVAAALGIDAQFMDEKGRLRGPGLVPSETNLWGIHASGDWTMDLPSLIKQVYGRMAIAGEAVAELTERGCAARLDIVVNSGPGDPAEIMFWLESDLIDFLHSCRAGCTFQGYRLA